MDQYILGRLKTGRRRGDLAELQRENPNISTDFINLTTEAGKIYYRLVELRSQEEAMRQMQPAQRLQTPGPEATRASVEHGKAPVGPMADTDPVKNHGKAKGVYRAAVQGTLRRSLRLQSRENPSTSSNQPTMETATSQQEHSAKKKRRRLA